MENRAIRKQMAFDHVPVASALRLDCLGLARVSKLTRMSKFWFCEAAKAVQRGSPQMQRFSTSDRATKANDRDALKRWEPSDTSGYRAAPFCRVR